VTSPYFREMALTGVYHREAQLARLLRTRYRWSDAMGAEHEAILTSLAEAATTRPRANLGHLTSAQRALFAAGRQKYPACAACHGAEGKGVGGVGPPLAGSKWVAGDPRALIRIVLHGFAGGAAERKENIPGMMPAHGFLSDDDLAAILTFIRESWRNHARPIAPEDVRQVREETNGRRDVWSPAELRELTR
jgi:mono/diheme cytochrome c family protein